MTPRKSNPHLYEINLMPWLEELSGREGRKITLSNIPASEWSMLKSMGFDFIWLMGVWERSPRSRAIGRGLSDLVEACRAVLPDFVLEDIVGSPYAVYDYSPDHRVGSPDDLQSLRRSIEKEGLFLILDFVPNHTACDHPWTRRNPERFVQDSGAGSEPCPEGFFRVLDAPGGPCIAHGKDPYFPPWTDTAQINYGNPEGVRAMLETLTHISKYCHGLRCDMAMLVLRNIFWNTWGRLLGEDVEAGEFWPQAVKRVAPPDRSFTWMAEAYWGTDEILLQHGFDFTYDKVFYDLLRAEDLPGLKSHLSRPLALQEKSVLFLENHDEPRAMETFGPKRIRSAMVIQATLPGMRFWQHGQFEGRRLRVPIQLRRSPFEGSNPDLRAFSERLLAEASHPVFHEGHWELCQTGGWPDNQSHERLLTWCWRLGEERRLIAVNFSSSPIHGYVKLPPDWLPKAEGLRFQDPIQAEQFNRSATEVESLGLYVGLEGMTFHFFRIEKG
jgi:hypothetical protein